MSDIINYANNKKIREQVENRLKNIVISCKTNRQELEDDWKRYTKIWAMERGDNQRYKGRANLKYATARRAVETVSRKLRQIIIPEDESYLSISPKPGHGSVTIKNSEALEDIFHHYFSGPTKFRQRMIPAFRSCSLYGTTIVKTGWDKIRKHKRSGGKWKPYYKLVAPSIRVVDLMKWYIFPWTVKTIDEAQVVFEEFSEFESYIRNMKELGYYTNVDKIESSLKTETNDAERLDIYGHEDPYATGQHKEKVYNLIEAYMDVEVEDGVFVPCMIHAQQNSCEVFMIVENPFDHGEPPYSAAKYVETPDPFFYGQGIMSVIESLANQQNDTANQIMDNKNIILNPIVRIDPNAGVDHRTMKFSPGAHWLAPPSAVAPLEFPDMTNSGVQALQLIKGEILEASDATPNLPMQMRGQSRTATRDKVMATEMNTELSEFIEQLSLMVEDIARKTHANMIQYMPDKMYVRILRKNSGNFMIKQIKKKDIIGDYDFIWKASTRTNLDVSKIRNLMDGIRIFAAAGVQINFEELAVRFFRDGIGLKNFDDIIPGTGIEAMDPNDENMLLSEGRTVPVSGAENDKEHLSIHEKGLVAANDDETIKAYEDHIKRHQDGIKTKQELVQRAIMEQIMASQQGGPQGGNQVINKAPRANNLESNVDQGVRE